MMVYWMWAPTRLWKVMCWHRIWAHPSAYGFHLVRGAADVATVTRVLLEVARLKVPRAGQVLV